MTANTPVLYTTTTASTRFSALRTLFTVYIVQMALTVVGNGNDRLRKADKCLSLTEKLMELMMLKI